MGSRALIGERIRDPATFEEENLGLVTELHDYFWHSIFVQVNVATVHDDVLRGGMS